MWWKHDYSFQELIQVWCNAMPSSMFFQCFYSPCNSSSSCSFCSSCNSCSFCHYRSSCSRYLFYIQVFCELSTLFGKRWEWGDSLSALLQGWWANTWWILLFLCKHLIFFRSERVWCPDLLGLPMRRQCSARRAHCDDYLSPLMSMWKLPSKKNKFLLVRSAIRNQTIKSPHHIPSELPLLVELAPFQREFGKMSDSDDDECCPELVEEDLSKVGNKIFYVFFGRLCLLSVSCKNWRLCPHFEICALNNILIGSSHCNYWPTWLR